MNHSKFRDCFLFEPIEITPKKSKIRILWKKPKCTFVRFHSDSGTPRLMSVTMREKYEKYPEPLKTITNGDSDTNPRMKGIILSSSFATNLKHHNHVDKTDCHEYNMSNQSFLVTEYRTESKNIGFIFSPYYKVHKIWFIKRIL